MYRVKVRLDTYSQIQEFVSISNTIAGEVSLVDNANHCVNAKSILGCLYSIEFDEMYVISDDETILNKFVKFIA